MKALLLLLPFVLAGCAQPSVEVMQTKPSPGNRHLIVVKRLNYHATVPYVWEVEVQEAPPNDNDVQIARLIGSYKVSAWWDDHGAVRVSFVGGRVDKVKSKACVTGETCFAVVILNDTP